jgi:hypothetical protein
MRYTIDMASNDVKYLPSFMKIGSGIQIILRSVGRAITQTDLPWFPTPADRVPAQVG